MYVSVYMNVTWGIFIQINHLGEGAARLALELAAVDAVVVEDEHAHLQLVARHRLHLISLLIRRWLVSYVCVFGRW